MDISILLSENRIMGGLIVLNYLYETFFEGWFSKV